MTEDERAEVVEILQGLAQANAEHAEKLVAENAALRARIRELEAKPPTYEDWRRAAYDEAIDRTSKDVKEHIEGLDRVIAEQRESLDREYRRNLALESGLGIRRLYWMRLALANRRRAGRLDVLYRRWKARAQKAEGRLGDRWGAANSELVVAREEARAARNNALQEVMEHVQDRGIETKYQTKWPGGAVLQHDLLEDLERMKR